MARFWRRWTYIVWCYGLIVAMFWEDVLADKNKLYHISSLCGRKHTQQLYKKTDGAVLVSNNEDSLDCVITFQTDSVLQKFMLRFEQLQLDCNDHLYIYDGAHVYSPYKHDLSCRNNHREVGTIYTRTNFVTLKYMTDGWGHQGNGFQLVLTAFKDTPLECRGFRCRNNLCIHEDLKCDLVNHCGDNSDESSQTLCFNDGNIIGKIHGVGVGVFIGIIVISFVTCFGCVVAVAVFIYRRQRRRPPTLNHLNTTTAYPYVENARLLHCSDTRPSNETIHSTLSDLSHDNLEPNTSLSRNRLQPVYPPGLPEKPPPYPGNLYPPQEGMGYNVHQGSIYYPTK